MGAIVVTVEFLLGVSLYIDSCQRGNGPLSLASSHDSSFAFSLTKLISFSAKESASSLS